MFELYPFQAANKSEIRFSFREHKAVMYQAGTGTGKTVTSSSIISDAAEKGTYTWFVAHRRELIEQAHEKLTGYGLTPGIIMAGYRPEQHRMVQVCSIDTLRSRVINESKLVIPHSPKFIVVDEAHRAGAQTYQNLFEMFPDAYILGLSATPARSSGHGLGNTFTHMVQAPDVKWMIEHGYLVQPRYFTGATADMTGVPIQNYDYNSSAREHRMNQADLRGDVVENWLRHGERRKSIVFASGVRHSKALERDFRAAGVRAVHLDGETRPAERRQIIKEFRNSDKWEVITNCMVLTEGFDCPEVGCVSLACPTKSIVKYIQMGGRCLRKHEESGKKDCIILDHAGAVTNPDLGFLEDPVPWTLDTNRRIEQEVAKVRESQQQEFVCTACSAVFVGRVTCPECGTRIEMQGKHELITSVEELIEVTRLAAKKPEAAKKQKVYTDSQKRRFYAMLSGYAEGQNKGGKTYSLGWVANHFRKKFGHWPDGYDGWPAEKPDKLVNAFIRAHQQNYIIRKRKEEEARRAL